MPTPNWQPSASFLESATPPLQGPTEGTLVQLPCINVDWLPLVLGGIDQLRNPSTWLDTLSDSARENILAQADFLRSVIAASVTRACVNPVTDITWDCSVGLTEHFADGSTDLIVTPSQLMDCLRPLLPPPPGNPRLNPSPQIACNYSGYLAGEVIQHVCTLAYNQQIITHDAIAFAQSLLPFLESVGFIVTAAVADFALAFFQYINDTNKGNFQTAATDPLLKGLLTCAIYTAIQVAGQVTETNFPSIVSNIGAISYTYPVVISAIHDFVLALGSGGLASMQTLGALADEDCSECGAGWCHSFDFRTGMLGWTAPDYGAWTSGVGWTGSTTVSDIRNSIEFNGDPFTCTGMECDVFADHSWVGPAVFRSLRYATVSSFVRETDLPTGVVNPLATFTDHGFSLSSITELACAWSATPDTAFITIQAIRVYGTGPIPNGWDLNCG